MSYQRRPERPGPNQLWPLPDSTDAQRLSVGNAGLLPFLTNAYEAGARLLLGNGQNVTLSLQVDHTPNPIIPVNRADSLGLPTLGLAQRGGIQRLAFTVVWLEFSRSKPVQWHVLAQVGRQESLVGFNDQLRRFNNTYAFAAFSLRWNPSSRTSWKADVNQTFLGQASSAANWLNYRLEATLNLESEVRKRGYLSLRLRHTRNLNTQQRPVEFTLIDASLRSYFLEDNRLSVELGLQNALDVTRLYEYRSDTFQQQEQFTNRLPRFGSIGLTYYFSRWRSGKR
ncbi:MAG: outer membrane beta-barrel family protein [Cytophagaceae bacterium]|nr:outer membrane beta-barrel family protein [Cytophagaceae bacterium]